MYDYITGKIEELQPTMVVVENNGIGYVFLISLQTFSKIEQLSETKIYVHQYLIRDELPVAYGFFSKTERELFRLLVGVSGVGGNTARMILSTFSPEELREIVSTGNSLQLRKVKGLGLKTSEKVILELRDKILTVDIVSGASGSALFNDKNGMMGVDAGVVRESLSALVMLGFARSASEKVVKVILSESPDYHVEQVIKEALKRL